MFYILELSHNLYPPGDSHPCNNLGLIWPSLTSLSVQSLPWSIFAETLTGKLFLKCDFSYDEIHTPSFCAPPPPFFFFSSKHIVAIMEQLVFSTDIQNSITFISWWWWSPALCPWAKPSGLFWFCFWGVGGDNIVQVLRVKHIWNHFSPFLNSSLVLWGHVLNQFAPVLNTTEDALLYLKFCWAGKPGAEAVMGFAMLQFCLLFYAKN